MQSAILIDLFASKKIALLEHASAEKNKKNPQSAENLHFIAFIQDLKLIFIPLISDIPRLKHYQIGIKCILTQLLSLFLLVWMILRILFFSLETLNLV